MKITDITAQVKRQHRFSVFVDGKYSFSISSDDLLEQKLKVGDEFDQPRLEDLVKLSGDSLLLESAYAKCLRRPHSEKEIRDFLWRKQAEPELIDRIIKACYRKHLLDDELFAEKWHAHRRKSNKSAKFIRAELQTKGVDQGIVDSVVTEGDEGSLLRLIEKKRKSYPDKQKLLAYLMRKGFTYDEVKKALDAEAE